TETTIVTTTGTITEEATEGSLPETTPEPLEEATDEPGAEATAEPTSDASSDMTDGAAPEADDIVDTITDLGNFSTLVELLEVSGLTDTLRTEGPFTFFAPTDAAFAALPGGTVDGLLSSSPDDLSQILLYHMAQGE